MNAALAISAPTRRIVAVTDWRTMSNAPAVHPSLGVLHCRPPWYCVTARRLSERAARVAARAGVKTELLTIFLSGRLKSRHDIARARTYLAHWLAELTPLDCPVGGFVDNDLAAVLTSTMWIAGQRARVLDAVVAQQQAPSVIDPEVVQPIYRKGARR